MRTTEENDRNANEALIARLLADEADSAQLSSSGWGDILARLEKDQRRSSWPVAAIAVTVTVLIIGIAIGTGLLGKRDSVTPAAASQEPVWPYAGASAVPASVPDWGGDPGETASRFLATLNLLDTRVVVGNPAGSRVRIITDDDSKDPADIGVISLGQYPNAGDSIWGVTGATFPNLKILSPKAGDRFDPPASVRFRSQLATVVTVKLYTAGRSAPLGSWTDSVDQDADVSAQLNFELPSDAPTSGYFVITAGTPAHLTGIAVLPVMLGSV